jgi:hypothetical protein
LKEIAPNFFYNFNILFAVDDSVIPRRSVGITWMKTPSLAFSYVDDNILVMTYPEKSEVTYEELTLWFRKVAEGKLKPTVNQDRKEDFKKSIDKSKNEL